MVKFTDDAGLMEEALDSGGGGYSRISDSVDGHHQNKESI